MKKTFILFIIVIIAIFCSFSFKNTEKNGQYAFGYNQKIYQFRESQQALMLLIKNADLHSVAEMEKIKTQIAVSRMQLKSIDFWLRYLEPIAYKKLNGPLPIEWETEVFEKFEKPYKREGAGLTLAEQYLDEEKINKDSLQQLIQLSISTTQTYLDDSISSQLQQHHHFYLANRLFLLNLAAIYTTGFECPDTSRIVPELRSMMADVQSIYISFNAGFPLTPLTQKFLILYQKSIDFVNQQPQEYSSFDHFSFIRDYVNPLFTINQQLIGEYKVFTKNFADYSLNNKSTSIFSKDLYFGQNSKGIFLRVSDKNALAEIEKIGKLLFYDPILSGNNQRSCNSCHKSTEYFTDTSNTASFQYNRQGFLSRNTPSLINASYNHLLMLDGKHISLQNQAKDVITHQLEMGSNEKEVLQKLLSCNEYKKAFNSFLKYTPQQKEVSMEHVAAALTIYYSKFSNYNAAFDETMNKQKEPDPLVKQGFNIFMSKAQCGTCHFVPQFNGVKPPYVGSEFEVLGVPADTAFKKLSADKGRYGVHPAPQMLNAFRTGSVRNAAFTAPYMHNGIFTSLQQVIEFYNAGGGAGRGLAVNNQTLSSDTLRLTEEDKKNLILFIHSLTENINFDSPPATLPASKDKILNKRSVGGEY